MGKMEEEKERERGEIGAERRLRGNWGRGDKRKKGSADDDDLSPIRNGESIGKGSSRFDQPLEDLQTVIEIKLPGRNLASAQLEYIP